MKSISTLRSNKSLSNYHHLLTSMLYHLSSLKVSKMTSLFPLWIHSSLTLLGSIKSPCFKSISTMLSHHIHSPLSTLEFICLNCDLNSNDLSFILQSITAFKDQSLIKGVSLNLKGNRLNKRGILFLCECIKSMGDYTKKWKIILSDNP